MPTVKDKATGDVVSKQPYTAEGTQRAETIVQANNHIRLKEPKEQSK